MCEQAQDDKAKTEGTRLEYTKESVTYRAKDVWGAQSFHLPTSLHDFYRYIQIVFYSSSYQRRPYETAQSAFFYCHQGLPARRQFLTSANFQTTKSILILLFSFNPATQPSLAPHMAQLQTMQANLPLTSTSPPLSFPNGIMTPLGNVETTLSLSLISFVTGYIFVLFSNAQGRWSNVVHTVCLYAILMKSQRLSFGSTPPQQQLLKSIAFHSSTIATFTWESSLELDIISSQVDILYFNGFIGRPGCQHMSLRNTVSVNDDHIRPWAVSPFHLALIHMFSLTMRKKPGGAKHCFRSCGSWQRFGLRCWEICSRYHWPSPTMATNTTVLSPCSKLTDLLILNDGNRMYEKQSTAAREHKSLSLYELVQTIDPVLIRKKS
ncbi:hypothetical protein ARMGADRAFT_456870 [Armillaria gallica]|uniref:Uncharacterized protein n=1 Tax=Armillaria gallica TaxID=47427 RepID=A0A2H3CWU8_ARMGA|nr:hypothetical protein ARMGADRAFT_456870 [Armillaria gallica]